MQQYEPSLAQHKLSPNDFRTISLLGEGTYSVVQLVEEIAQPNTRYAMKVVDKSFLARHQKQHIVLNEKRALLACQHPSIIRLYHTFRDEESLYFILELAQGGDVAADIKRLGRYDIPRARYYMGTLLAALHYMHYSVGLVHRDIKPENMLLDSQGRLKLADFGSCQFINDPNSVTEKNKNFVGTAAYVPPEALNGESVSGGGADWWAAGCVMYQMLIAELPFQGATEYLTFQSILHDKPVFPKGFDSSAKQLIKQLMNRDPQKRFGTRETDWQLIKSHPFFAGLDLDTLHLTDPPPQLTPLPPFKLKRSLYQRIKSYLKKR